MLYKKADTSEWLEESFHRCAKDRFECVSVDDLKTSIREASGVKEFEDEIERLVAQSDPYGDGRISMKQFREAIRERTTTVLEINKMRSTKKKKRRNKPRASKTKTKDDEKQIITVHEDEKKRREEMMMTLKRNLIGPSMKAKLELTFLRSHHIDLERLYRILRKHLKVADVRVEDSTVKDFVLSCKTDYLGKVTMRSLMRACSDVYESKSKLSSERTDDKSAERPGTASSTGTDSNILHLVQNELKFSVGLTKLRKLFVQCDIRRCGAVEISVLRRALLRMGLESGKEATELFLEYCDPRGDGEVTYGNFIKALR